MKLEGGLIFDLYRDGSNINSVKLRSSRPLNLVRTLRGRRPAEALEMLGLMYRICGIAQRYAAIQALREASGTIVTDSLQQAQQLLVNLETLREHLWQILVVWPEQLREKPRKTEGIKLLSRLLPECEAALFDQQRALTMDARLAVNKKQLSEIFQTLRELLHTEVFGVAVNGWRKITSATQLITWAKQKQTVAARLICFLVESGWQRVGSNNSVTALPATAAEAVVAAFKSGERDLFVARPTWQGECCESNVYTRQMAKPLVQAVEEQYGVGLLTRAMARLVEVVELMVLIDQEIAALCDAKQAGQCVSSVVERDGQGLAMVEAARGRLAHWLVLEQGRIADYAVLAPTEWNFHPQGVAVQGLVGLLADDEQQLKQQAALWINSIDPCVAFELNLH